MKTNANRTSQSAPRKQQSSQGSIRFDIKILENEFKILENECVAELIKMYDKLT